MSTNYYKVSEYLPFQAPDMAVPDQVIDIDDFSVRVSYREPLKKGKKVKHENKTQ